jgi:hypothetical protein
VGDGNLDGGLRALEGSQRRERSLGREDGGGGATLDGRPEASTVGLAARVTSGGGDPGRRRRAGWASIKVGSETYDNSFSFLFYAGGRNFPK